MIGDRIKTARGSESRKSFAEKIGVHPMTLGKYENGKVVPGGEVLAEITKYTKCEAYWLLTGESEMHSPAKTQQPENTSQCPSCADLQAELAEERTERRILAKELREINAENRTILKENGELKEKIGELKGELKARAAPKDIAISDSPADAASSRKHA
ncbi:helix-turn-helix domain-containing protein [Halodesulfovibrio sp. MK-HDV]|uniref:helix-turn-helix domain-containing protein n=1 Tax=Halodesulfovibrio sp. MK-HDV TaxID=2599925 RepID=UPI0013688731|nr:helix-turn-helix transcriptional regulator [Halodesulfovibrio sp. MK-HDV]KAF1073370.1 HTH-type transcriptional regulator Xre [Halodesulfovibrio sp. MK-HDV]